jgi:hypothetical protein
MNQDESNTKNEFDYYEEGVETKLRNEVLGFS